MKPKTNIDKAMHVLNVLLSLLENECVCSSSESVFGMQEYACSKVLGFKRNLLVALLILQKGSDDEAIVETLVSIYQEGCSLHDNNVFLGSARLLSFSQALDDLGELLDLESI